MGGVGLVGEGWEGGGVSGFRGNRNNLSHDLITLG